MKTGLKDKDKAKDKKATIIGNKNATTSGDEGMDEEPGQSLTQQIEAELEHEEAAGDEGDAPAEDADEEVPPKNLGAELDAAAKKRKITESPTAEEELEGTTKASRQQWEDMGGDDEAEEEYEQYEKQKWDDAGARTAEEIAEGAGTSSASAGNNPGNNLGNNAQQRGKWTTYKSSTSGIGPTPKRAEDLATSSSQRWQQQQPDIGNMPATIKEDKAYKAAHTPQRMGNAHEITGKPRVEIGKLRKWKNK